MRSPATTSKRADDVEASTSDATGRVGNPRPFPFAVGAWTRRDCRDRLRARPRRRSLPSGSRRVGRSRLKSWRPPPRLAARLGCWAVSGSVPHTGVPAAPGRCVTLAFVLGAFGLFGAPYVVFLHRYSDAPSGERDSLPHDRCLGRASSCCSPCASVRATSSSFAGALLMSGWRRRDRGQLGAAELVLSLHQVRRRGALDASRGVAWALMWWFLDRSIRRGEASAVVVPMAAGGASTALVVVCSRRFLFLYMAGRGLGLGLLVVASAVTTAAGFSLLRQRGPRAVAGAYAMPAAAITSLTWLEQATGASCSQPILIAPAMAGVAVALAGATLWGARDRGIFPGRLRGGGRCRLRGQPWLPQSSARDAGFPRHVTV